METASFHLPNGNRVNELEVTVPGKPGTVKATADMVAEYDRLRDLIHEHQERQGYVHWSPLPERLASVIASYERTTADALQGAGDVRDDVVSYLRAVMFVIQTVTDDHVSHAEAKARLRGALAVLGRQVASLREERFNFRESIWRRSPDLFRWDEPERRLREKVRELEAEVKELRAAREAGNEPTDD